MPPTHRYLYVDILLDPTADNPEPSGRVKLQTFVMPEHGRYCFLDIGHNSAAVSPTPVTDTFATEADARTAFFHTKVVEMNEHNLKMQRAIASIEALNKMVRLDLRQCCARDHNFDGNCDIHKGE